jgi:hypothetical protein
MHQILIIRDVRLHGVKPKGNEVLEVDENTPLKWPVAWALDRAKHYHSSYVWLKILAHGYGTPTLPLATGYSSTYASSSTVTQGGSGLQFCKEGVSLATIGAFGPLAEWLDWIDICSCGTAFITGGNEGRHGDGNVLCSRLAQITQAPVRASTATQTYDPTTMDFGAWEGVVLTYGPKGNVIDVETNPRV